MGGDLPVKWLKRYADTGNGRTLPQLEIGRDPAIADKKVIEFLENVTIWIAYFARSSPKKEEK